MSDGGKKFIDFMQGWNQVMIPGSVAGVAKVAAKGATQAGAAALGDRDFKVRNMPSSPTALYSLTWASELKEHDPNRWGRIVGLLKKDTATWNMYSDDGRDLEEDAVAMEMIAGETGKDFMRRFDEEDGWPRFANIPGLSMDRLSSTRDVYDRVLRDYLRGFNPSDLSPFRGLENRNSQDISAGENKAGNARDASRQVYVESVLSGNYDNAMKKSQDENTPGLRR